MQGDKISRAAATAAGAVSALPHVARSVGKAPDREPEIHPTAPQDSPSLLQLEFSNLYVFLNYSYNYILSN